MFVQVASILLPLLSNPAAVSSLKEAKGAQKPEIVAVSVRPAKKLKKGSNAILELSLNKKPDFRAIGVSYAGKQIVAKDDGVYPDRKAGDGVFAVRTAFKEAPTTTSRGSFSNGEGEVVMLKWKIKLKLTACPSDCTSLLGGSCWICVEVTEVEVGN